MNATLPSAIDSYLSEAGFSATEMLVLRKLVEEDSLTLRELASKTGKSTGVLDQAMKKLLSKSIAKKGTINGQPRYSIQSLDAVLQWVKKDMMERKDLLDRRHRNFEEYIASLKVDKKRPDMEHFSGEEGIKKAYEKLLESGKELLTLTPVLYSAEDDPLRAFRVDYFRKRQVHNIFQRILSPDTPLSRRFQSRDAFEYRRTLLLPQAELPVGFERTVAGDTVACINFQEQSACLLHYPELAASERAAFETLWNRQLGAERGEAVSAYVPSSAAAVVVPLKTRLLSSFREFILGPRSIVVLCLFALLAGVITFGLYQTNREQNIQRLKDKVLAIALTGSLQFESKDIEAVHKPDDITKPEYAKLVATLGMIRRSNADIQYAYLMRPSSEAPGMWEFVADADSIDPNAKIDTNHDGVIDDADALNYPSQLYDPQQSLGAKNELEHPQVFFTEDQWGTFLSANAPIRNESGKGIAIIGIDVFASQIDELSAETFTPLYAFVALFVLFALIRYGATNRSLLDECWQCALMNTRKIALWIISLIIIIAAVLYGFHWYTYRLLVEETGKRLMAIAVSTAGEFDPDDLNQLHFARDMKTEAYQRVFTKLNEIRNKNQMVTFAYIMRPTDDPYLFEFIVDADMNYNLPLYSKYDIEDRTPFGESDEAAWPGVVYDDSKEKLFFYAMRRPSHQVSLDQWGAFVAGCAPIFQNGQTIAIVCFDRQLDVLQE